MEFSFEYTDFWQGIHRNLDLIYAFGCAGVLLLFIPLRLITVITRIPRDGKFNSIALFTLLAVWLMGAIGLGLLTFTEPSAISVFLVYVAIVLVTLLYMLTNANLIYKVYQSFTIKDKLTGTKT